MVRKVLTVVVILLALFFWYVTLTVPMIVATMPAILALAFSVGAYFVWPKRSKNTTVSSG